MGGQLICVANGRVIVLGFVAWGTTELVHYGHAQREAEEVARCSLFII